MPQYLSAEWLAEADRALAGTDAAHDATLVVEQVVTAGPAGDTTFHVVADGGRLRVRPGAAPVATVSFVQDYATAAAIAKGELSAQGAFMTGRIRVRGDLPRLVEHQQVLQRIDDVLGPLRARTEY